MSDLSREQKCVLLVLDRIKRQVEEDQDMAIEYAESIDPMLCELNREEFFGGEGQCDPRGDFRNGEFSMLDVEGVEL